MLEFTAFYVIFSFCFVFPPSAFTSAGLTVPNLLASWLGSEDLQFIQYHLGLTCATLLVHSLLPLGYFSGIALTEGLGALASLLEKPLWLGFFGVSLILPCLAAARVYIWKHNEWDAHPLVISLKAYANSGRNWQDVAAEINIEFRRYLGFIT